MDDKVCHYALKGYGADGMLELFNSIDAEKKKLKVDSIWYNKT